jgi:hypothetical protein
MKKAFLICALSFFVFILGACASGQKQEEPKENRSAYVEMTEGMTDMMTVPEEPNLLQNKTMFLAKIEDGKYKKKVYPGTGEKVEQYFDESLAPYVQKLIIGSSSGGDIIAQAKKAGAYYAAKVTIVNWEPRVALASGKRSRVQITFQVYTVANKKEVLKKTISGYGSRIVLGRTPEAVAAEIIAQMCDEIFQ